jgi:hypothetical protein
MAVKYKYTELPLVGNVVCEGGRTHPPAEGDTSVNRGSMRSKTNGTGVALK